MRLNQLTPLIAAAACAAALAAVAGAATPATGPTVSFTIDGAHIPSGLRPSVGGNLTCTKNAHYHLSAWLAQPDRGALAKGSIPAKLPARPTAAQLARARAASLCTGASQPWALTLASVGKQPTGFAAGAATACVVLDAGKSHLYTLTQQCTQVTLP